MRGGGGGGGGRRSEGGRGRGTRNFSPNPRSSKMKDNNNPPRPPRRSLSPRNRRRASPEHSHRDRGKQPVTRIAGEGYEFPRKYMMDHSDAPALDLTQGSKPPPHIVNDSDFRLNGTIIKEPNFCHQDVGFPHMGSGGLAPPSSALRGPDTLSFLDGNYYTQPTGYLSGIAALRPENIGGGGFNDGYLDRPRDLYMERDKGKLYPNDSSFPTSSSAIAKDDLASLYRDRYPLPSDGFSKPAGVNNLFGLQSEHSVYDQPLIADPMRRRPLSPPARYARPENVYDELDRSKRSDQGFLAADNGYQKNHSGNHVDFRDRDMDRERDRDVPASSFMDQGYLAGDSVYKKVRSDGRGDFREAPASTFRDRAGDERADAFFKNSTEGSFRDRHRSFHGDAAMDYRDMRAVPEDRIRGFGSDRGAARMMSSRDDEVAPFEDRYSLKSGPAPISYRERSRSPLYSDRHTETYRPSVNHSRGVSRRDNMDAYELSPERMARGKYGADDEFDTMDERGAFSNDRRAFRRRQSPSGSDEIRPIEDRLYFPPSKRLAYGHQQHRKPTRRTPRSDGWLQSGDSSAHGEGDRLTSLKKRLRPGPSEFNDSIPLERRQGFFKPNKSWKKGFEDRHVNQDTHQGDTYVDGPPLLKTDPPEDSEEFKQQIHKAFLRFCKALNENPHQQKKYQEQGKAGSLLCCVCGRLSKQFVDTHSLVTHAYNSLKMGLKTEHLGLHKALCVLMGWNWLMPPETGKAYQSTPVTEAEDLKTDLILWPPVVVVHNSSIRNKNDGGEAKVVTIEAMEEILREMGFGAGKTQVGLGRPSNRSVLLVKFMPTFSGLQEAERLHKHYADNSRGRQEFELIFSSGNTDDKAREAQAAEVEETLYGYMAVVEDLGKLDPGTKKRSVVKSRKDIEAIADAPLNAD